MGIQSIICLLTEDQLRFYAHVPGGLLDYYRQRGLAVESIGISDPAHDSRGEQELQDNLERIYQAFRRLPKPVLVHCSAGWQRTGPAVDYIRKRLKEEGQYA